MLALLTYLNSSHASIVILLNKIASFPMMQQTKNFEIVRHFVVQGLII